MRRLLVFAIVTMLIGQALSAEKLGSVSLPVYLDLSKDSYVEIGFSQNGITNFTDEVIDISGGTVSLIPDENTAIARPDSEIYVYWKILASSMLSASLEISDSLIGPSGEALEWFVTKPISGDRIESTGETQLSVFGPERYYTSIGSTLLDIGTEALDSGDVVPGEYKSELKLSISVE